MNMPSRIPAPVQVDWTHAGKTVVKKDAAPVAAILDAYLLQVRKIPLLDPAEQQVLVLRYQQNGDLQAAGRLILSTLRLVLKIALEYHRRWQMNLMDLIQEGNLGLIRAVNKFDPWRGVPFSVYASYWIRAYMLQFIMDNWRLVRIGTSQTDKKLFFNLNREKNRLEKMGLYAGTAQLAAAFDVAPDKIVAMEQRLAESELPLDTPPFENWRENRSNYITADAPLLDDQLAARERRQLLQEKLAEFKKDLSGRELTVLEQRMLADTPLTLHALGTRFGISKERVRQIQNKLQQKAQKYLQRHAPCLAVC